MAGKRKRERKCEEVKTREGIKIRRGKGRDRREQRNKEGKTRRTIVEKGQ